MSVQYFFWGSMMVRLFKVLALFALVGTFASSTAMAQIFPENENEAAQESVEETAAADTATTVRTVAGRAGQAVKGVLLKSFGWFNLDVGSVPSDVASGDQITGTDNHSDVFDGVGVWFNGSHEFLRFDQTDFEAETSISSGIVGADKFVADNILLGVAVGRSSSDTENLTRFAVGVQTTDIKTTSTSGTLYGAYIFNENIYVDASAGVTRDRINTFGAGNATTKFKQSANTRYASVNGYYIQPYSDDLVVTYQAGVLRSLSRFSSFVDEINGTPGAGTEANTTQYSIGGQASHLYDQQTVLNGGAVVEYFGTDREIGLGRGVVGASGVANQQVDSRFQVRFSGGVDHSLTDNLTLSGELGLVMFREDADNWNAGFNIRYDF